MQRDSHLLFGPLAAAIFLIGIVVLARFVPGYDQLRQTVSEIGAMDSPMRWPIALMLWIVAACILVFAIALRRACVEAGHNAAAAYLTMWMTIAATAIGFFAYPHPWHNFFGESELIAYQAPLAFALTWSRDPRARGVVGFSWIMYALILVSLGINMAKIVGGVPQWPAFREYYGVMQRSLFACYFAWVAGIGFALWRKGIRLYA